MTAAEALEKRIFELEEELRAEKQLVEKSQGDVARLQADKAELLEVLWLLIYIYTHSCSRWLRSSGCSYIYIHTHTYIHSTCMYVYV